MNHSERKHGDRVFIVLFLCLIIIPTVLWLTAGDFSSGGLDEKRTLAEFPSELSDDFLSEAETWYGDHAPYRNDLITLQKSMMQATHSFYRHNLHSIVSEILTPAWYDSTKQPYFAPEYVNDCGFVIYGKNDWLFLEAESNMDYYKRTNLLSDEKMSGWEKTYRSLYDACQQKGIRFLVFITPSKEEVYSEYMPSYQIEAPAGREEIFSEYMKQFSPVPYLYPIRQMTKAKEIRNTYYQQDTHWNAFGAYVGLREIYQQLSQEIPLPDQISVQTVSKIGGDLGDISGYRTEYPDYKVLYRENTSVSCETVGDTTLKIFRSDDPIFSGKLFLAADSMSGNLAPYLTRDFSVTYVTNFTNEKDSAAPEYDEILRSLSAGDCLILLSCERNDGVAVRIAEDLCGRLS